MIQSHKLPPFYTRTSFIYFFAGVLSLMLSAWTSIHETVINPDGICYLLSAEAISQAGLRASMHLCPQSNWPLYAILINGFVKLTHVSYVVAAFIIDGLCTLMSVTMFIAIVHELGGSRRVLWFAAAVILLSHEFNSVRQYIVRDHGFWAFYLASVYFLLRFFSEPKWLTALGFSASLMIATLFRIEGAVFLVVLPWLSWFCTRYSLRSRAYYFFMLNSLLIIIAASAFAWLALHPQITADQLGRLPELMTQTHNGMTTAFQRLQETKAGMLKYVIPDAAARDIDLVFTITMIVWYFVNVIGNVSLIYTLLVLYAWFSRTILWTRTSAMVVVSYLVLNVLITALFFAQHLFLSKRYLIALSLILMLWVPFSLNRLLRKSVRSHYRKAYTTALVLIVISAIGGIISFGHSKTYVREAGDWMAHHIPPTAKLYANRYQLMYYSKHFGSDIFRTLPLYLASDAITGDKWRRYDYIAVQVGREDRLDSLLPPALLKVEPQEFKNSHGDRVLIYRVPDEEKHT